MFVEHFFFLKFEVWSFVASVCGMELRRIKAIIRYSTNFYSNIQLDGNSEAQLLST